MKLSLFYELQCADPHRGDRQLFQEALEQCVLADRLGFHAAWAVEHHGLEAYSHSSAPEIFLSFIAAKTERLKIGHGVCLTAASYNHPIRTAERAATLDLLSEGRLLFGTGKSASPVEFEAFQLNPELLGPQWLESLRALRSYWSGPTQKIVGSAWSSGEVNVVPKPYREGGPPMFVAASSEVMIEQAGRLGLGLLHFAQGSRQELADKIGRYRELFFQGEGLGGLDAPHVAIAPCALLAHSDEEACRRGFPAARYFGDALAHYYRPSVQSASPRELRDCELSESSLEATRARRQTEGDRLNFCIGDSHFARRFIGNMAEIGVDELLLISQMGSLTHAEITESIQIFANDVYST